MCAFFTKSGMLRYRRATTPRYRDVRDRSTWEVIDTLFYEINDPQPGQEIDFFTNESSLDGDYTVWIMRCGPKDPQTGAIQYVDPRRPLIKIAFVTYTLKRLNVVGKFTDSVSEQPGITTNSQNLFCVIHATGTWTGATNLIIDYEPNGRMRTVRVIRALN